MRRTLLLSLVVFLASVPALAQRTALEWKFDRPVFLEVRHTSKQVITLFGQKRTTDMTVRFVFEVRPGKVTADATTLDLAVVAVEDKSVADNGRPEEGTLKGFAGQKFRVVLGPRNRSLTVEGAAELAPAVFGEAYRAGKPAEKRLLEDVAAMLLKSHLADAFMALPDKPVAAGDTWHGPTDIKLPPIAQIVADRQYTLAGPAKAPGARDAAGLEVKWSSAMEIKPMPDDAGALPFKVVDIRLTGKPRYGGTAVWDVAAGRPATVEAEQAYEMTASYEGRGNDGKPRKFDGDGSGQDKISARFSATNPEK